MRNGGKKKGFGGLQARFGVFERVLCELPPWGPSQMFPFHFPFHFYLIFLISYLLGLR